MKILDRYVLRAVIGGTFVALLIIIAMQLVFMFVDEASDIGTGRYTAVIAFLYVLLQMPSQTYQAFPMATLIGSLMGLGALANRHELVVMRAAGVSIFAIARTVVIGGFILGLLALAMGEWVSPPATRLGDRLRSEALSNEVSPGFGSGFWARDGDRFIQVDKAEARDVLDGVHIYQFDAERRLLRIVTALRATYGDGGWNLQRVTITAFNQNGIRISKRDSMRWASQLRPSVLDVVVVDPQTLSLKELSTYIHYLERNGLETSRYRLAYWIKLSTPLATVVMLLLTIPLVFGSLRSAGGGQRIFIGVLIGLVFFLSNQLLNRAGLLYGLPPLVSAMAPTALFCVLGLVGISRVR